MSRRSFTACVHTFVDRLPAPRGSRAVLIAGTALSVFAAASAAANDVLITNIITNNAHKAKLQDDGLTNAAVNMIYAVQT